MIEHENPDPVQRLIATLDDGPDVGYIGDDDIEALPIEVARTSARVLGLDPRFPSEIAEVLSRAPAPAQSVINALSEHDLEDDEIARIALDDVLAALNEAGINYAGVGHICKLIETNQEAEPTNTLVSTNGPPRGANVVPLPPPREKRINRYCIVAGIVSVAAAVACFLVLNRDVISQDRIAALHTRPDSTIVLRDDGGRAFASNEAAVPPTTASVPLETATPLAGPRPPDPLPPLPPQALQPPASGGRPTLEVARPMTAAASSSALPPPPAAPTSKDDGVYSQAFAAYQSHHYEEAVRQSLVCAADGNAQCMYLLGRLYADGLSAPRDYRSARAWYARAAGKGYTDALYAIALLEFQGGPGLKQNCAEGRKWLIEAVKHGAQTQVECR
jgi:Sel1 repeat